MEKGREGMRKKRGKMGRVGGNEEEKMAIIKETQRDKKI